MTTDKEIIKEAEKLFALLDKYLITDLETMIFEIKQRKSGGGLGFPAIHSIVSGMELLGLIMSGKTKSNAFDVFWDDYLEKKYSEYKKPNLKKIFRNVIRNGTAHYFLVKSGVAISKKGTNHLQSVNGSLNIDLKVLFFHFHYCYDLIKTNVLENKTELRNFNKGFDKLYFQMTSAKEIVDVFLNDNSLSNTDMENDGASGVCFKIKD